MKNTKFIQFFMTAVLAVGMLPEAQAASRASTTSGGTDLEGKEWNTNGSWWNREQNKLIDWVDGSSVAFYNAEKSIHPCTLETTLVQGQYTTTDLRFYINHELLFDSSKKSVYVVDSTAEGKHGHFTLDNNVTLKLTRKAGTNACTLGFSNFNTWNGTIQVGTGVTLNIGREGDTPSDVTKATDNTLEDSSIILLDGGTFNLKRNLKANKTVDYRKDADLKWDEDGELITEGDDYFAGEHQIGLISVVTFTENGGTITNAKNHKITQTVDGQSRNFVLQTEGDDKGKAIDSTGRNVMNGVTFYKGTAGTDVAVSTLQETSGNKLATVELSAGTLTVDQLVSSVTVNATGGTLAFVGPGRCGCHQREG